LRKLFQAPEQPCFSFTADSSPPLPNPFSIRFDMSGQIFEAMEDIRPGEKGQKNSRFPRGTLRRFSKRRLSPSQCPEKKRECGCGRDQSASLGSGRVSQDQNEVKSLKSSHCLYKLTAQFFLRVFPRGTFE
jgi:hypothetical protein